MEKLKAKGSKSKPDAAHSLPDEELIKMVKESEKGHFIHPPKSKNASIIGK